MRCFIDQSSIQWWSFVAPVVHSVTIDLCYSQNALSDKMELQYITNSGVQHFGARYSNFEEEYYLVWNSEKLGPQMNPSMGSFGNVSA